MTREMADAYASACEKPSDINEHVPRLRALAMQCAHVTEFGVRYGVSSVALLAGMPDTYIGYDWRHEPKHLRELCNQHGIYYEFHKQDTAQADPIEETDLLFIDSKHTYAHLREELRIHGNRAGMYLAFHDTEHFGKRGADGGEGLLKAIEEFLEENPHWKLLEQWDNNNGLTILAR